MDAGSVVGWVCDNQDLATAMLGYGFGIAPAASALAWLNARYNFLPPWAHRATEAVALNLVHAVLPAPALRAEAAAKAASESPAALNKD